MILCNVPAKAGLPVLEDFVRRSTGLLKADGKVFLVAVNTLAGFFRSRIAALASPIKEKAGNEHTVFVYGKADGPADGKADSKSDGKADSTGPALPLLFDESFPQSYPFYIRHRNEYEMEKIPYRLDTVHGAADFDSPGGAVQAAAKLAVKIGLAEKLALSSPGNVLIHDDAGQGHFALWLAHYLEEKENRREIRWLFSGRNVLALAAAKAALASARAAMPSLIIPSADIFLDREALASASTQAGGHSGKGFALIAFFPEAVPETDRHQAAWDGLSYLAAGNEDAGDERPGGIVIAAMSSTEAERFDRKKPAAFARLGEVKRRGFRALAYRRNI